ncbi:MAG: HAD family hydrolase [Acidimicrobiia bacterium]
MAAFLDARGISLPWGTSDDVPGHDTVCAVGNRKNAAFVEILRSQGADAYPGSVALVDHLDEIRMPMAVVSASENCGPILESVGLAGRFIVQIDGLVASALGLEGKPEPDPFLEAARRLNMDPARCVVIEDAVSGVAAGSRGGFGLVIGVDRHGDPGILSEAGADLVVSDLGGLVPVAEGWSRIRSRPSPGDLPAMVSMATLSPSMRRSSPLAMGILASELRSNRGPWPMSRGRS